jgi:hypothetical protein
MEALRGFESKFRYSIVGHSGDSAEIPFVKFDQPPQSPKERLKILRRMRTHAEVASSGDSTLEAIEFAATTLAQMENSSDELFLFAVSDANFRRYGIKPAQISSIVSKWGTKVNIFVLFIASVGEEAQKIQWELPAGKAFLCLDNDQLPGIFKQIFTSQLFRQ